MGKPGLGGEEARMEGPAPGSAVIYLSDYVLLAVVAFVLLWLPVSCVIYNPYGLGLDSGILTPGQIVTLCNQFQAALADKAIRATGRTDCKSIMYEWDVVVPTGEYLVESGTPCVVTIDPAWDEDGCSRDRPIAIKLAAGKHKGLEVAVPRKLLRKR